MVSAGAWSSVGTWISPSPYASSLRSASHMPSLCVRLPLGSIGGHWLLEQLSRNWVTWARFSTPSRMSSLEEFRCVLTEASLGRSWIALHWVTILTSPSKLFPALVWGSFSKIWGYLSWHFVQGDSLVSLATVPTSLQLILGLCVCMRVHTLSDPRVEGKVLEALPTASYVLPLWGNKWNKYVKQYQNKDTPVPDFELVVP